MTGVHTEDTLTFLTKPQIIDLFLKMQEHTDSTISKLTDEIRNSNANFERFESDVEVSKKVDDALVKQNFNAGEMRSTPEGSVWR